MSTRETVKETRFTNALFEFVEQETKKGVNRKDLKDFLIGLVTTATEMKF